METAPGLLTCLEGNLSTEASPKLQRPAPRDVCELQEAVITLENVEIKLRLCLKREM